MNLSTLPNEEKQFLARIADVCRQGNGGNRPCFTHFLNERQILIARAYLSQSHVENWMIWGGWEQATRCVLGVFPPFIEPEAHAFNIGVLSITYRALQQPTLSHRDFLGAIMRQGVARDSIGDILPQDTQCTVFALQPVAQMLQQELKKVGGMGVYCTEGTAEQLHVEQQFETLRCVVSSKRLDGLISALTHLSRDKSAKLIQAGQVQQNYSVIQNGARDVVLGDILTIRGYGKYVVDEIGAPTKKGRLPILIRKFN